MKTNSISRRMIKAHFVAMSLAIAGLGVIEFCLAESVVVRIGQTTGTRSDFDQAPNVSISDFMGVFR